jgi:hypothetical protein
MRESERALSLDRTPVISILPVHTVQGQCPFRPWISWTLSCCCFVPLCCCRQKLNPLTVAPHGKSAIANHPINESVLRIKQFRTLPDKSYPHRAVAWLRSARYPVIPLSHHLIIPSRSHLHDVPFQFREKLLLHHLWRKFSFFPSSSAPT